MGSQKKTTINHSEFDILARVDQLMQERVWTQYELSKKSGIPQSTISTWWSRNYYPGIDSIEKLCKAFGITLSQFFISKSDEAYILTTNQKNLMNASARLNDNQYASLIGFIESL